MSGSGLLATSTSAGGWWSFLTSSANWSGSNGFPDRLLQHLGYTAEALGISLLIGIPLGFLCGHTGRGGPVLSMLSNASRALPTLGLLVFLAIEVEVGFAAAIIPLVLLGVAPILVNTYVGVRDVDRALVDSAVGMGLRPLQVLLRVEVPVALPVILLGLRVAALQVVATAAIAADVGLGGLGRFIIDGEAFRNLAEVVAGGVMVAAFALAVEGLLLLTRRLVVSPGLRAGGR